MSLAVCSQKGCFPIHSGVFVCPGAVSASFLSPSPFFPFLEKKEARKPHVMPRRRQLRLNWNSQEKGFGDSCFKWISWDVTREMLLRDSGRASPFKRLTVACVPRNLVWVRKVGRERGRARHLIHCQSQEIEYCSHFLSLLFHPEKLNHFSEWFLLLCWYAILTACQGSPNIITWK